MHWQKNIDERKPIYQARLEEGKEKKRLSKKEGLKWINATPGNQHRRHGSL